MIAASGARRRFDLAVAHGSNDLALAAAALRHPGGQHVRLRVRDVQQHHIGCRLARRVLTPDAIPPERLRALRRRRRRSCASTRASRRSTTSRTSSPTPRVLDELGVDRERVAGRRAPAARRVALSPQVEPALPAGAGRARPARGRARGRGPAHGARSASTCARSRFPSLIVPDGAVDAQSLIALADLVVSAGGTMNREAVALGTPVYTTYGGRLGGVDEALIREGRLRPLTDPRALELVKRRAGAGRATRRDPRAARRPDAGGRRVTGRRTRRRRSPPTGRPAPSRRTRLRSRALRAHGARASSRGRSTPLLRALDVVLAARRAASCSSPVLARVRRSRCCDVRAPGALPRRARRAAPAACSRCTSSARCAADAEARLGPYLGEELTRLTERELTRVGRRAARHASSTSCPSSTTSCAAT